MKSPKAPSRIELMSLKIKLAGEIFSFFHESGNLPFIKFQKIPNISNIKWNSRATLTLLTFFLMLYVRERETIYLIWLSKPLVQ